MKKNDSKKLDKHFAEKSGRYHERLVGRSQRDQIHKEHGYSVKGGKRIQIDERRKSKRC
jgi:hypothetical protein